MIIQITGLFETQRLFNSLATRLENDVIVPELDAWSRDVYQGFLSREHEITGRMKASTRVSSPSRTTREVSVNVSYAEIENSRAGSKGGTPHRYVEPTLQEQNPRHFDALVNKITRFVGTN